MGRIDGVHIIRRERRILLLFIDGLGVEVLGNSNGLDYCLKNILVRHILIGLHTREPQRRLPLHRVTRSCHNACTLGKPLLYIIGVAEQVTNALDGDLGEVGCCSIQLTVRLEYSFVLELALDLLARTNKRHTIHGGHHGLLDDLAGDVSTQTFGDLDQLLVAFVFDVLED